MDDIQKKIKTFCRDRIINHLVFMKTNGIITQEQMNKVSNILYEDD